MIGAVTLLAAAACGPGGAPAPLQEAASVVGRVQLVGATPFERVVIERADSAVRHVEVRGEYREELRRLTGAKVRASGPLAAEGRLMVEEYEILEIAGHVPVVGRLEMRGGKAYVQPQRGEPVEARAAPAELLQHHGAKVWVILDSTGAVTGYGIIRER